jgi:hypothetical protein
MKLGFVGYSEGEFDQEEARRLIILGLFHAEIKSGKMVTHVVSGLTDQGIPGLAYQMATSNVYSEPMTTVGIACSKAKNFSCFPVDDKIIVGKQWGDESDTFLQYIDALVRIGGGKQSHAETKKFRELKPNAPIVEFELPRKEDL